MIKLSGNKTHLIKFLPNIHGPSSSVVTQSMLYNKDDNGQIYKINISYGLYRGNIQPIKLPKLITDVMHSAMQGDMCINEHNVILPRLVNDKYYANDDFTKISNNYDEKLEVFNDIIKIDPVNLSSLTCEYSLEIQTENVKIPGTNTDLTNIKKMSLIKGKPLYDGDNEEEIRSMYNGVEKLDVTLNNYISDNFGSDFSKYDSSTLQKRRTQRRIKDIEEEIKILQDEKNELKNNLTK